MLPRDIWSQIEVVFFDAEGTLFLIRPSVGHIYVRVCQKFGLKASPKDLGQSFKRAFARYSKRLKAGEVELSPQGCLESWRRVFLEAVAPFGTLTDPDKAFKECYEAFAQPEAFALAPGAREVLESLRQKNKRLTIISNWDERLRRLLRAYGLDEFFERLFISCEVGLLKPAVDFYQLACSQMGVAPHHALMVGDNLDNDILAARRAGLWALHYTGGDLRFLFPD